VAASKTIRNILPEDRKGESAAHMAAALMNEESKLVLRAARFAEAPGAYQF